LLDNKKIKMKYIIIKQFNKGEVKKKSIISWNKVEHCYTIEGMSWIITPLLEKKDINWLLKNNFIKRL
jgi:adenosylmethionine-8-amino-7-oxononanoate aminotransferase